MRSNRSLKVYLESLEQNWPEAVSVESDTVMGLLRFSHLIQEVTEAVLRPLGLSQGAFEVLAALRSLPDPYEVSPTDLSNMILFTSGGTTKVLKGLELKGLIVRIDSAHDRRSRFVKLTKLGKFIAEESMMRVKEADQSLFRGKIDQKYATRLRKIILDSVDKLEN